MCVCVCVCLCVTHIGRYHRSCTRATGKRTRRHFGIQLLCISTHASTTTGPYLHSRLHTLQMTSVCTRKSCYIRSRLNAASAGRTGRTRVKGGNLGPRHLQSNQSAFLPCKPERTLDPLRQSSEVLAFSFGCGICILTSRAARAFR